MPCLLGLLTTENNMMFDLENGWCPIRKGYLTEKLYTILFCTITNQCSPYQISLPSPDVALPLNTP